MSLFTSKLGAKTIGRRGGGLENRYLSWLANASWSSAPALQAGVSRSENSVDAETQCSLLGRLKQRLARPLLGHCR